VTFLPSESTSKEWRMQRLHPDECDSKEQDACAGSSSEARDLLKCLAHDLSPVLGKIELNE